MWAMVLVSFPKETRLIQSHNPLTSICSPASALPISILHSPWCFWTYWLVLTTFKKPKSLDDNYSPTSCAKNWQKEGIQMSSPPRRHGQGSAMAAAMSDLCPCAGQHITLQWLQGFQTSGQSGAQGRSWIIEMGEHGGHKSAAAKLC